jgi:hypothetical protein
MGAKLIHNLIILITLTSWVCTGCGALSSIPTATSSITPTNTLQPLHTLTPISSSTAAVSKNTISIYDECQQVVDGLYNLRKDLGLPEHLLSTNPVHTESDFDPNQYFQVLTHISMASEYKLDYVYYKDSLGGAPFVYAHDLSNAPFQSYIEFLNSVGENMSDVGIIVYQYLPHHRDYLDKILIDGSPESYFEYVTLGLVAHQFYLWQRGQYNDEKILCNSSDMEYVYKDMTSFDLEFPPSVKDRVENIDFSPTIVVDNESVKVSFVSFSKWSGFFRSTYVLEKDNPGHWQDVEYDDLIEYQCGIEF